MTEGFRGRHVVVTGGGSGLGATIAAAFAVEGADLTLMGRTLATLEEQVGGLRRVSIGRAEAALCDVTDPASVARAFDAASQAIGPVHLLINNAGHAEAAPVEETTLEAWQRTIAVNLTGTFLCTQQVLPAMIAAGGGRIINVASTAGLKGYARVAAYCAAKHGVVGFTRALAVETARSGITVNAVCPGYIEGSSMLQSAIANVARVTGKSVEEARALLARQSPTGFVTMQEVANAVLRLCASDASATTGQVVVVAGGEVMS